MFCWLSQKETKPHRSSLGVVILEVISRAQLYKMGDPARVKSTLSGSDLTAPLMGRNINNAEEEEEVGLNGAGTGPPRGKQLPFKVGLKKLEEMCKRYSLNFYSNNEKRENLHPCLAYERNYLLHRIVSSLTKSDKLVCDVGGSPKRLKYFNHNKIRVIHLCPQLQPGDAQRFAGGNLMTTCFHNLETHLSMIKSRLDPHPVLPDYECCKQPIVGYRDCHVCVTVDTYVFCHSAYYIKPDILAEAIDACRDKMIYVVGHKFLNDGNTHWIYKDEARYTCVNNHVVFEASGNGHQYVHSTLPWNNSPTFTVNGKVYEATLMRSLGETCLWTVQETCYPAPPPKVLVQDWRKLIVDEEQEGEIQTTLDPRLINKYVNDLHNVNFNRFTGAGRFVIAHSSELNARVPRGAISEVSKAMIGKERNSISFSHATNVAKGYVNRSNLPIEEQPIAILVATVIGFTMFVELETNMIDTARYRFGGWWGKHANSLKLGSLTALPLIFVMFVLFVLDASTIVVDEKTHITHHPILIVGVVVNAILFIIYGITYWIQIKQAQDLASSFTQLRINDGVGVVPLETLNVPSFKVPASRKFTELSEIEEGSSLIVGPEPKPPDHEKPTLFATGFINPYCMPVTAPSTQEAEIVALTNRVLAVNPYKITGDGEEDYRAVFSDHPSFLGLKLIKVNDSIQAVKKWLSRSKYNQKQREAFLDLARKIRSGQVTIIKTSLSHVKSDEKLLKTGLENKAYTPRIVCASDDTHNVATGPFMWEWSNRLTELWSGRDMIYYTRGASAEDIGNWFSQYLYLECGGNIDDIFAIEDDFEKYDSSICAEHQEPVKESWVDAGAHATTVEAFSDECTAGKTRKGLKYKSEQEELNSGKNCTNALGSVINAAVHVSAIMPILHPKRRDRMAVMGDDNLMLRNPILLNNHMTESEMQESLREAGMRPSIMIRRHVAQVEFCSRIFLESAKYPGQWVLSPKPGRVMSKMGWNFIRSGNTLYQDVLSNIRDCMHVPFLRHYVRRTKELVTPKKFKAQYIQEWDVHAKVYHDRSDGELPSSTWAIVHARYGLSKEDEERFGEYMNSITSLECVLSSITLETITKVDCP